MKTPQKPTLPPSNTTSAGDHNDLATASAQLGNDVGCLTGLVRLSIWLIFLSVQIGRMIAYGWVVPLLRRNIGSRAMLVYCWFGTIVLWSIAPRFSPGVPTVTVYTWASLLTVACVAHQFVAFRRPDRDRPHSMNVGDPSQLTSWLLDRLPGGGSPFVAGLVYEPLLLLGLTYGLAFFDDPNWRTSLKSDLRFPAAMIPCLACIAVFTQTLVMFTRQGGKARELHDSEAEQRAQSGAVGSQHASGKERSADGRVRLADILPAKRGGAR